MTMDNRYAAITYEELSDEEKQKFIELGKGLEIEEYEEMEGMYELSQEFLNDELESMEEAAQAYREGYAKRVFYDTYQGKSYSICMRLQMREHMAQALCDKVCIKASLSENETNYIRDELQRLKISIVDDFYFGQQWVEHNKPTILEPKLLEQWFGTNGFPQFLERLHVIYFLEIELHKRQNAKEDIELLKRAEEKKKRQDDLIRKWFLVEDGEAFIEKLRPHITVLKGKGLYALILAMQRNKQIRVQDYSEVEELHSLLASLFGKQGTSKALRNAINEYASKREKYISNIIIETRRTELLQ